jgi:tripartite-type tricarboxylate transporter receptor subunit TctC
MMKAFLTTLLAAVSLAASAQTFPDRPLRLIVAQPPGSSVDLQARLMASRLSQAFDKQVIVDNRPGANGVIGLQELARSKPDGYSYAMAAPSPMTINQFIYKDLPYKPLEDFVPVSQLATVTFVLVANPATPFKTVGELVAHAKANPGKLNYSSPGVGNLSHLGSELLATEAGIKMQHIPAKGDAAALTDVVAGSTDFTIITLPAAQPHIRSGKLKLIATAGQKRATVFPDAPTIVEAGYPSVVIEGWSGVIAPAGTPPEILARMQKELLRVINSADVKETFNKQGSDVVGSTPEQFGAFMRAESAKWERVIKGSGIRLE